MDRRVKPGDAPFLIQNNRKPLEIGSCETGGHSFDLVTLSKQPDA
jgi:hypothetical protein